MCEDYRNGNTWNEEIDMLIAGGMPSGDALMLATAAGMHLCPDDAPDLGS